MQGHFPVAASAAAPTEHQAAGHYTEAAHYHSTAPGAQPGPHMAFPAHIPPGFMLVPTVGMPAPGGMYTSPGMYGQGVGMPFMAPAGMPAGPPAGQVGSICRAFPLVKPGSPIQVGAQAQGPAGANVFIFHLPNDMSNTDLYHYFLPFGPVLSARIIVDRTTGRSKGYGFVSFSQPEHAAASIASLDGTRIGHKRLKVTLKHEKGSGDSGKGRQGTAAGAAAAGHRKAAPAGSPPQP